MSLAAADLVAAWRERARTFRRQAQPLNARCHTGRRQFLLGLAAMCEHCADELTAALELETTNERRAG